MYWLKLSSVGCFSKIFYYFVKMKDKKIYFFERWPQFGNFSSSSLYVVRFFRISILIFVRKEPFKSSFAPLSQHTILPTTELFVLTVFSCSLFNCHVFHFMYGEYETLIREKHYFFSVVFKIKIFSFYKKHIDFQKIQHFGLFSGEGKFYSLMAQTSLEVHWSY